MAGRKKGGAQARSAARLAAVQALYQMDMAKTDLNDIIEEFTAFRLQGRDAEDEGQAVELASADQTYFAELVRGAVRRQRDIDPLVDQKLATGWRLVRVDSTLRAIFRAAVFELMDRVEVPARVVINEYINVAHAFFSDDQSKVVNGLLDQLARELRAPEFDKVRTVPVGDA
ncbi:MAG: transcription antitermination factor NusB [Hyphomicrobiaceae bacterium]